MSTTHGHTCGRKASRAYEAWQGMKGRCYVLTDAKYHAYGARGISVCDRWLHSFENFLADMGEPPPGKSLDRFPNNDGNYEPNNCRWATPLQQANNTRQNRILTCYAGEKGRKTLSEWSRISGAKRTTITQRLNAYGWTHKQAVFGR